MTNARRRRLHAWLGVLMTLAAASTRADADEAARASASDFFDAGAAAYEAGQYLVAAEAFMKAHELTPSPSLLFSAAQAYRRHCLAESSVESLRRAVALYREYLRVDPQAKRREDAMQALEALIPLEGRLAPRQASPAGGAAVPPSDAAGPKSSGEDTRSGGPAAPAAPEQRATRLLLTTRTEGAEVSVDGGPFSPAPHVAKVEPGRHQVRARAPGYHEGQLTIDAVANELMPGRIDLRPKPARLRVTGTNGARVTVDGQVRVTTPTDSPIAIEPGAHFIAITRSGREPYTKRMDLTRDSDAEITVRLPMTSQRIAAWTVLAGGAAGVVAGGALSGVTLARQSEAVDLRDRQKENPLLPADRDHYNRAVTARDDLAVAAAITSGAAVITVAVGLALFLFDEPEVLPPSSDREIAPSKPEPRVDFDVGSLSVKVTF